MKELKDIVDHGKDFQDFLKNKDGIQYKVDIIMEDLDNFLSDDLTSAVASKLINKLRVLFERIDMDVDADTQATSSWDDFYQLQPYFFVSNTQKQEKMKSKCALESVVAIEINTDLCTRKPTRGG